MEFLKKHLKLKTQILFALWVILIARSIQLVLVKMSKTITKTEIAAVCMWSETFLNEQIMTLVCLKTHK